MLYHITTMTRHPELAERVYETALVETVTAPLRTEAAANDRAQISATVGATWPAWLQQSAAPLMKLYSTAFTATGKRVFVEHLGVADRTAFVPIRVRQRLEGQITTHVFPRGLTRSHDLVHHPHAPGVFENPRLNALAQLVSVPDEPDFETPHARAQFRPTTLMCLSDLAFGLLETVSRHPLFERDALTPDAFTPQTAERAMRAVLRELDTLRRRYGMSEADEFVAQHLTPTLLAPDPITGVFLGDDVSWGALMAHAKRGAPIDLRSVPSAIMFEILERGLEHNTVLVNPPEFRPLAELLDAVPATDYTLTGVWGEDGAVAAGILKVYDRYTSTRETVPLTEKEQISAVATVGAMLFTALVASGAADPFSSGLGRDSPPNGTPFDVYKTTDDDAVIRIGSGDQAIIVYLDFAALTLVSMGVAQLPYTASDAF